MQLFLLLVWFAVCAERDARHRQLSNGLTFGAGALFLFFLLINGHTWLGATEADGLWALLLALAFTLPGYALNRLGAGDVKLLAAVALASDSLHLLGTFIGAGVSSLIWLTMRRTVWLRLPRRLTDRYTPDASSPSGKYPFVPFLLVGFIFFEILTH
ncbi:MULTISPECIES: prepilin peptidase [unclassified Pseudomonas]|uniref:prepilin peptidase n=1 Tax=unclassified Pseudomonas TaxID=196821 RepID=UPI002AC9666A|nr:MULTISPECIES: prepilin peptidase [unclassified Pseudomonas]MEB0041627.1 prepilin peptidase [Pseudomonas sp. MH10]MEB0121997.1 prepilin peptidase [Pseudomonas sp. CCI1.2]WPX61940.1 prepilin peptidase [Pseudomonas sp. MH10]